MIRVDRAELTRNEIIRVAANRFLNEGYSKTTVSALGKALNMSTGNITFHFPTKEHMLAELVDILCKYQWVLMKQETPEGEDPIVAMCLELLTIASACEQDAIAKEFFLTAYTSPLCLDIIRKNDMERAKQIFAKYCDKWENKQFAEMETLVSGIEYATLMTTDVSTSLPSRIRGALETILTIYNVPEAVQKQNVDKVLEMDYKTLGLQTLERFRAYVDDMTEQALIRLLARKQVAD